MVICTNLPITAYKNVACDHTTLFKVTLPFRGTSSCVFARLEGVVNLALMSHVAVMWKLCFDQKHS